MKKIKTIIIFLDAVRKSSIKKDVTPFMYNLVQNETYLDLESQLGYSSGIHPSIWKGVHQEKHGYFLVYSYDPENSHFKWMNYLKIIPAGPRKFFLASLKAPYYWSKNKNIFPDWYKRKILPVPASIDPILARYFKKEKTIYEMDFFNIIKENGLTFSLQPEHKHAIYGNAVPISQWCITENTLDFFFTYETDPIGHYYGPNSKELDQKLSIIDVKIKELYGIANEKYDKVNLFLFSDHGMVEVKNNINVQKELETMNLIKGVDYIPFYDSTMVRFWIDDLGVRDKIINKLNSVKHLTYLDENLKNKYHINFKSRKWGDLFFLADPGYRIFPDNFAPVKFNTKGMHGYFPEFIDSKGIFITNCLKTNKKTIRVIDIMPTMLKVLNLEKKIPEDVDGKIID